MLEHRVTPTISVSMAQIDIERIPGGARENDGLESSGN